MSTPQMSEGQLRDVLQRVVPEAPDSVADPAPVVRAARVRRRAQVVLAGGAVAVIAVAAVVGGRALTDDDSGPQVASEPTISADPYAAVPCPEADALPANGPLPVDIVAARFCPVPFNGFPATPGPPDALVEGLDSFTDAVAGLPVADPARCAAVDVLPTDSRLLFELADGSLASVPTGFCQDVTVAGHTVDAAGVTQAFVGGLDGQRDRFSYAAAEATRLDCETAMGSGAPATPGRERLVEAMLCSSDPTAQGDLLAGADLALVAESWQEAARPDQDAMSDGAEGCLDETLPSIMARTNRGDLVRLTSSGCDHLSYASWEPGFEPWQIPMTIGEISVS